MKYIPVLKVPCSITGDSPAGAGRNSFAIIMLIHFNIAAGCGKMEI
jgi:hypothetical protein